MPRRVSLPAADELFRPSAAQQQREVRAVPDEPSRVVQAAEEPAPRRSSGRVRHDEKMTVYVTAEELLDLEHARLTLRRDQGLAVDRGRLVREAVAMALADLESNGEDSEIVRRLLAR